MTVPQHPFPRVPHRSPTFPRPNFAHLHQTVPPFPPSYIGGGKGNEAPTPTRSNT